MTLKVAVWTAAVIITIVLFTCFGIPFIVMMASRSNGIVGAALLTVALIIMAVGLVAFHPEIGLWSDGRYETELNIGVTDDNDEVKTGDNRRWARKAKIAAGKKS